MKKLNKKHRIKYLISLAVLALFMVLTSLEAKAFDKLWDYDYVPSERQKPLVYDLAELLDSSEEEALLQYFQEISTAHQCNVAVLTVDDYDGDIQAFTDDYFDYNGMGAEYGDSGILFMIAMDTREFCYCTDGIGNYAFTDYGKEEMTQAMLPDLSEGNYYDALKIYGKYADKYLQMYEEGTPYDVGVKPAKTSQDLAVGAIGSLIVALIVALIPILVMKAQLNTVHMNASAQGYQSHKGINMTQHTDSFRTTRVTKTPRPKDNDSRGGSGGGTTLHTSSSGHSHGGGHGHF
jgi:uncharacterized protein